MSPTLQEPRAVVVTNSAWTLWHFRRALLRALASEGLEVVACGPPDPEWGGRLSSAGIRYEPVYFHQSGTNPLRDLRTIAGLYRLYRRERPRLVHHFSTKAVIYGSLAAHLARVPRIFNTVTGKGYGFRSSPLVRSALVGLYRAALRGATATTFQNPQDRQDFLARGIVDESTSCVIQGSGVDTDYFAPAPEADQDGEPSAASSAPLRFLMFSRMIWDKGVREYIDAADAVVATLREEGSASVPTFTLLGGSRPGNPEGVLDEWINNPGAIDPEWLERRTRESAVRWLPHDDDVRAHILQADVVVLPSY
ncbi:MAG: glycosyltransferase family 1 protein, partial [Gemmatimonadetes bacterium]